jgi:hypothetical protein
MGCTELTPKQALFTRTRGDDWVWSWTITGDVSAWDEGTLLIQIREGTTEDGGADRHHRHATHRGRGVSLPQEPISGRSPSLGG